MQVNSPWGVLAPKRPTSSALCCIIAGLPAVDGDNAAIRDNVLRNVLPLVFDHAMPLTSLAGVKRVSAAIWTSSAARSAAGAVRRLKRRSAAPWALRVNVSRESQHSRRGSI